MRTIAFVSQKGGTSKSTLARHCAVAAHRDGLRTVVMDCDQQATLRGWGAERGKPPEVIAETSTARRYVEQSLAQMRGDGIEVVMIDTPGSFEGGYSANAVALADYVVIPCRPSGEDTATFWETEKRVTEARKPFGAVVTLATTTTGKPAADLMALFTSSGVAVCPHVVHQRQIVPNSYSGGLTVFEVDRTSESDERAVQEMQGVWQWLARVSGVRA